MGVVVVCACVLWFRMVLKAPTILDLTLLEILSLPILMSIFGIVARLGLGWMLVAAPPELRWRPRSRRLAHLGLSIAVTALAIAALYGVDGPFGARVTAFALIFVIGEISLSVAFKLIDCMVVVVKAVGQVPTTTGSPGPA